MSALTAQVKGGRLVLDEPTNLPEGATVRVEMVDSDDLDDAERALLHESLDASEAEADDGAVIGEDELWMRLRDQP
jgi:hypothetical protein